MRRILTLGLWTIVEAAVACGAVHPDALRAVERIRGHAFSGPVQTVTISRADLPRILRQRIEAGTYPSAAEYATALEALELIGDSAKATEGMIDLYSSQVMAFYDLDEHRYYAIDSPPASLFSDSGTASLMAEAVEIHELTHALQDQRFGAGRRAEGLRYDWDAQLAYQSVLEGEATLVMMAWMGEHAGLPLDQVVASDTVTDALAAQAAALSGGASAERYFAESLTFPYVNGLRFVIAAYRKGGWAAVDALDRDPPATTAEIIDPAGPRPAVHYPTPLHAAAAAGTLLVTHLGLFNWRFLLGEAPSGWRGDTAAVFQDERCQTSVLVESQWATEESARDFARRYVQFLEGRGIGARSSQRGKVVRVAYGQDVARIMSFMRYESNL